MANNGQLMTSSLIKWGITILGGLVLAGAVSVANRDVYNKEQVDEKITVERQWSDAQDRMMMKALETQGENISQQLAVIREDQKQIKSILMKDGH